MKRVLSVLLVAGLVSFACANSASAEDNKVKAGAKKVGNAIVWPFKKMGQGMKAMGEKTKKMFKK
ncbi:MAG: hypothetical protein KIT34_09600 [Cyanobacteria bacterium TGS_CYA1]|jgi:hypothetical protein|nr:hypothetical protein [bacterium]MCW5823045.1 hypothetical protein [Cyanobacteria bacterium TGS_CYA1]MDX2106703.1 hypothetical protein [Candidatus Melainabacteria bacterium]QQR57675.1 MAG: hypothetical protein IPG59_22330 [Candidatus Melainabacteria bacterium]